MSITPRNSKPLITTARVRVSMQRPHCGLNEYSLDIREQSHSKSQHVGT